MQATHINSGRCDLLTHFVFWEVNRHAITLIINLQITLDNIFPHNMNVSLLCLNVQLCQGQKTGCFQVSEATYRLDRMSFRWRKWDEDTVYFT